MAKGEIARFEQFLLLSQCFPKSSAAEVSESVYMRGRVKDTCPKINRFDEVYKKCHTKETLQ